MDCSNDSPRRVEEACPDRSVLERLLLGLVSGKVVGPLEEHVHDCGQCAAVMGTIQAADPLVEAVRALPQTTEEPDDTRMEALVEALCKLPVTVGSSGHRPSLAETAEQLAPFLDPPEGPGDLGRFGPYRVIRILGSGGMGIALEAEEPELERRVALKVMNPALATSRSARDRFLREARTAASIEHDNVVAIHRVGEHRDLPFLAMPLLKGESLADRLRSRGKLGPAEVVQIGQQIAAALAAAHQQGVVHRDVKPDNCWLEAEPNEDRVKILDFGLARAVDDDVRLTRRGVIAGTPAYMAPEQAQAGPVDERADLFSLGCVLYEMCTGRGPFTGSTTASLLLAVTRHQPAPPHRLDRRVPKALSDLVMKLLKKDPARRVQTAQQVLDLLERCPRSSEASAGWRLKTPLLVTLAAFVAGIGLLAFAVIYFCTGEGLVVLPIDPAEVTVTVDGREARVQTEDGMLVIVVPSGKRRIAISKRGSAPHVEQLWVFRGGRRVLALELESARSPRQPSGPGKTETAATPAAGKSQPLSSPRLQFGPPPPIKHWDPASATLGGILSEHPDYVCTLAFSPDGALLFSGSRSDPMVRIWDLVSGQLRATVGPSQRHAADHVQSLALSADGSLLAFVGAPLTVKIWNSASGELRETRDKHKLELLSVAISPDGSVVAAGWHDGTVRMFDPATAEAKFSFPAHPTMPASLAFHPDGSILASASHRDGAVKLWVAATGKLEQLLDGHQKGVWALAFSPDGSLLASASDDRTVIVWDVGRGSPLRTLEGHTESVQGVAFSPDGAILASRGADHTVRLWDVATWELRHTLQADGNRPRSLAFSPDGSLLGVGDGKRIKLFTFSPAGSGTAAPEAVDRAEGSLPLAEGTIAMFGHLAISEDGRLWLSGGEDKIVRLWDIETGQELQQLVGHTAEVQAVAFSPDGRLALSAGKDRTVRIWDLASGGEIRRLEGHGDMVVSALFSPDGQRVLSGSLDGTVRLWDGVTGEALAVLRGHTSWVRGVAFSPDGRFALSGANDATALVWDLEQKRLVHVLQGHKAPVNEVVFLPGGRLAVTIGFDDSVRLWDVDRERQLQILPTAPDIARSLALVPGSWRLMTPGANHSLCLWDLKSGRPIADYAGHTDTVRAVAVSADGALALSSSDDGTVRRWRLEPAPDQETEVLSAYHFQPPRPVAGEQHPRDGETVASLRCFQGHTDAVRCVAFAPDGSRAVSGSKDGTVRLWEVADGGELGQWKGHTDDVLSVAFLADGERVVSGSRDGTVRIWDSEEAGQTACLEGHLNWVAGVAVSSDGKRIVSASLDRTVRVWDAESGEPLKTLAGIYGWHRALALFNDTRVVSGGNDGNLVLWDFAADEPAVEIGDPFSMFVVACLAVSPDGSRAVAGDWGGSVHLWDLHRRERVLRFEAHAGAVHGIAFLPHDRYVISGGEDSAALVWDTQEARSVYRFAEHLGPVTCVALSPDGRFVLTGSEDQTLRLWPLPVSLERPNER